MIKWEFDICIDLTWGNNIIPWSDRFILFSFGSLSFDFDLICWEEIVFISDICLVVLLLWLLSAWLFFFLFCFFDGSVSKAIVMLLLLADVDICKQDKITSNSLSFCTVFQKEITLLVKIKIMSVCYITPCSKQPYYQLIYLFLLYLHDVSP